MNGKKILAMAFFLALLCLPIPCQAEKIETKPFIKNGPTDMGTCAITIQFMSIADGIDNQVLSQLEKYIEANADITAPRLYPWGTEGEQTLCLNTLSSSKTAGVFSALKSILPAHPAHGRITLMMGEESYSVPGRPTPSPEK